jgi:hypothetical protein
MDMPRDVDALLHGILNEGRVASSQGVHVETVKLEPENRAFVEHLLRTIADGSVGIFIALHPKTDTTDRLQYAVFGSDAGDAIPIMITVLKRLVDVSQGLA